MLERLSQNLAQLCSAELRSALRNCAKCTDRPITWMRPGFFSQAGVDSPFAIEACSQKPGTWCSHQAVSKHPYCSRTGCSESSQTLDAHAIHPQHSLKYNVTPPISPTNTNTSSNSYRQVMGSKFESQKFFIRAPATGMKQSYCRWSGCPSK